jgi:predicted nucleic-acid-binding Zn-ribbon protein
MPESTPTTIDMMRCPKCGHRDSFAIEVRAWAVVSLDGVVEFADQPPQSDDGSPCVCPRCGRAGTVRDFVPADGGSSHG